MNDRANKKPDLSLNGIDHCRMQQDIHNMHERYYFATNST